MSKEYKHEFTVDRKRWIHGTEKERENDSALRRDDGHMCCLGFLALSCGMKARDIINMATPNDTYEGGKPGSSRSKFRELTESRKYKGEELNTVGSLMGANDEGGMTMPQREKKVEMLFKRIGIKVNFKGVDQDEEV